MSEESLCERPNGGAPVEPTGDAETCLREEPVEVHVSNDGEHASPETSDEVPETSGCCPSSNGGPSFLQSEEVMKDIKYVEEDDPIRDDSLTTDLISKDQIVENGTAEQNGVASKSGLAAEEDLDKLESVIVESPPPKPKKQIIKRVILISPKDEVDWVCFHLYNPYIA